MAGLRVALAITARRAAGGHAPRPPRTRRIWQALAAVRKSAMAPTANGMAVTRPCVGHWQIRRAGWRRSTEDAPTTQGQGVWRGMGAHDRRHTGVVGVSPGDEGSKRDGHGPVPYRKEELAKHARTMPPILPVRWANIYWHRIYAMDI